MADFLTSTGPDGGPVIVVSGEVDLSSEAELLALVGRSLDDDPTAVALDLAAVTFIDSSGLGALVRAQLLVTGRGGQLRLARVPRSVERVLELTGLADLFAERSQS